MVSRFMHCGFWRRGEIGKPTWAYGALVELPEWITLRNGRREAFEFVSMRLNPGWKPPLFPVGKDSLDFREET